jgi:hypothetical protein
VGCQRKHTFIYIYNELCVIRFFFYINVCASSGTPLLPSVFSIFIFNIIHLYIYMRVCVCVLPLAPHSSPQMLCFFRFSYFFLHDCVRTCSRTTPPLSFCKFFYCHIASSGTTPPSLSQVSSIFLF